MSDDQLNSSAAEFPVICAKKMSRLCFFILTKTTALWRRVSVRFQITSWRQNSAIGWVWVRCHASWRPQPCASCSAFAIGAPTLALILSLVQHLLQRHLEGSLKRPTKCVKHGCFRLCDSQSRLITSLFSSHQSLRVVSLFTLHEWSPTVTRYRIRQRPCHTTNTTFYQHVRGKWGVSTWETWTIIWKWSNEGRKCC